MTCAVSLFGIEVQKKPFEKGGKGTKGSWDLKYMDADLRVLRTNANNVLALEVHMCVCVCVCVCVWYMDADLRVLHTNVNNVLALEVHISCVCVCGNHIYRDLCDGERWSSLGECVTVPVCLPCQGVCTRT